MIGYFRECNRCFGLLAIEIVDEPYCLNCGCPEFTLYRVPIMKYLVVNWNTDTRSYDILHYSHHYQECENQFTKLKKTYPLCQLMFDYQELATAEQRAKFWEMQKLIQAKLAELKVPQVSLGILTVQEEEFDDA